MITEFIFWTQGRDGKNPNFCDHGIKVCPLTADLFYWHCKKILWLYSFLQLVSRLLLSPLSGGVVKNEIHFLWWKSRIHGRFCSNFVLEQPFLKVFFFDSKRNFENFWFLTHFGIHPSVKVLHAEIGENEEHCIIEIVKNSYFLAPTDKFVIQIYTKLI